MASGGYDSGACATSVRADSPRRPAGPASPLLVAVAGHLDPSRAATVASPAHAAATSTVVRGAAKYDDEVPIRNLRTGRSTAPLPIVRTLPTKIVVQNNKP
ncbi:hypothetical protein GCM10020369_00200 [Cryptosporangium minutisporangium]|uniref:Uncharacterized protein n=1 Tax=Cryptosporangium minutisporangium TaxID=113569 RepID=A0ABP6SQD9_9ACTN